VPKVPKVKKQRTTVNRQRTVRLDYLLNGQPIVEQHGNENIEIKGLTSDSRDVKKGYLFVAVKGSSQDGHKYLADAIQRGACALVVENVENVFPNVTIVRLPDTRAALSELASRFYNYPSKDMNLIGITGTNGKTTTSYILESILKEEGRNVGVIGTINYRYKEKFFQASLTTPESNDLMKIMGEMRDAGVTDIIIEVSSHSLEQGRVRGLNWSRALFTNFSRDHLDYHSTMEEYFKAKSLLFSSLGEEEGQAKTIINMDDPKGRVVKKITKASIVSYGLGDNCSVRAADIHSSVEGLHFRLTTPTGDIPITSTLFGQMNVYNILAAAAVAFSLDIDLNTISRGIERLAFVPGRLQHVENKQGLSIFVDYAHSTDALKKVLQTVKQLTKGRLITVFGCGGDRDKGKRPDMGRVAGIYSDCAIITSDNPRGESPAKIADEIETGVKESGLTRITLDSSSNARGYEIILDRRRAIHTAVKMVHKEDGDIILIAGKGHEKYQIIGNRKRHFNDIEEVELATS
jgi:UDP-N-acetylmuramoyl-L-alanyl-D-glutamate--2,6-diaminopimelate ligase